MIRRQPVHLSHSQRRVSLSLSLSLLSAHLVCQQTVTSLSGKRLSSGRCAGFSFANLLGFGGHSIKTHEAGNSHPVSHPELALSPTDIGIWTGKALAVLSCRLGRQTGLSQRMRAERSSFRETPKTQEQKK